jgi:hypothetical protein
MEYHQGEGRLAEILEDRAYMVQLIPCGNQAGYIYARRVALEGL